jgi:hypothetical protein
MTLWLTVQQAPGPIIETPATPVPARPKLKSPRVKSETQPTAANKFVGTWTAMVTTSNDYCTVSTQLIMVIQEKSASVTQITTETLAEGGYWNNLPEEYNTVSSFNFKCAWSSTDLSIEGANLRIRWPAGQTLDWNPKTMPFSAIQALAVAPPGASVFTLRGDQLTRELDKPGSPSFQRVRGSRK